MRTVCPSCQAAYDVPEAVLASGRTLRCVRCGGDFTPESPAAPATSVVSPGLVDPAPAFAPAAAPPAPSPAERLVLPDALPEPDAWSGKRPAVVAGWVASLIVLAAMGWGFVAWRGSIERVWPASGRVYSVLGLK